MKIRNHRKREWLFLPSENSTLPRKCYVFKNKSKLMAFILANIEQAINGEVRLDEQSFAGSYTIRLYAVWYNQRQYTQSGAKLKPELRQVMFRGRKYVHKPSRVSIESKKYHAFSQKVISCMCNMHQPDGSILPKDAQRLLSLFIKRGFKDFEPDTDEWIYINGHINDGIDFYHWSDRCNWLRTKTIIEYFKRQGLI